MIRHHITVAALILTFGIVSITEAQGGRRGGTRGQGAQKRLTDAELNLSEDQRARLQALDSDMKTRLDDIRGQAEAGDVGGEEARNLAQEVRDEYRTQRQSVFTPEQLQLIEQNRANAGDARGRGGRGPGGEGFGQLDLSDTQTEQLERLREEHRSAMDALRESGDATREDFRQLRTQQREEAEGLLTEDQRQQLQQSREQRRQEGQDRAGRSGRGGGGRSRRGGGGRR